MTIQKCRKTIKMEHDEILFNMRIDFISGLCYTVHMLMHVDTYYNEHIITKVVII